MSGVTVTLNRVDVSFGTTRALCSFSAVFEPGKVTALTGGDGAGKSTLLKLLAGRVHSDAGSVSGLPPKEEIGYQPADSGVWRDMSVEENLRFVAGVYKMDPSHARDRIEALMASAGLTMARTRIGRNLSGGMRQKLGFIMAALHEPDLLLLDEPTTGVDPASREDIWTLISSQAADGRTVVFATTYLDEAERSSTLLLMNKGRALADGTSVRVCAHAPGSLWQGPLALGRELTAVSTFGSRPQDRPASLSFHNWRRADTAYIWTAPADRRVPDGFTRCDFDLENASIAYLLNDDEGANKEEDRSSRQADGTPGRTMEAHSQAGSATSEMPSPTTSASMQARTAAWPPRPAADARPLLRADSVVKRFGSFTALHGVSLEVMPGQVIGLIGGNGAGKTTLMRILLGLEQVNHGSATLLGASPNLDSRRHIGYVPQGMGLYPTMTARENVRFAAQVYGVRPLQWTVDFARSLGRTPTGSLPLGSQRLLAYAVAVGHGPELLILDEPTSGMDPVSRMRLWRELHRQADLGVGVLVTTHYMSEAGQCDRCVILSHGRVQTQGTVDEITRVHQSLTVETGDWEEAFRALRGANLPVSLNGTTLRVPDTDESEVRSALDRAPGHPTYRLIKSRANLDEILTLGSAEGDQDQDIAPDLSGDQVHP